MKTDPIGEKTVEPEKYCVMASKDPKKPIKEQTIEVLKALKCMFDEYGIKFVLVQGLALGYARYKDIMDWDADDIDVGVFVPIPDKDEFPRRMKMKILFLAGCGGFRIHTNFSICIKYWEHKEDYFECKSGPYIYREHEKWFLNPQPVEFLGTTFLIPNDIEDYLDNHYGKGWETNIIKGVPEWLDEYEKHQEKYPWPVRIRKSNVPKLVAINEIN